YLGERQVGVEWRAAVAREVLGHRDESLGERGLDERRAAGPDHLGICRGRPVTDDHAPWVGRAVQNRREPGVETRGPQLASHRAGDPTGKRGVARPADRLGGREADEREW